MAEHNKWSKVTHIKACVDARKGAMDVFPNSKVPDEILLQLEA